MMRCQEKRTQARKQLPQQYINYTTDKLIAEKYIHSIIKQTVSITIAYQQFYSKVHVFPVVLMSTLQIISFIWRMIGTSIIISCYFRTCAQSNFKLLGLIFLQFVGDVSEKSRSCNNVKIYNKDTCWFVTRWVLPMSASGLRTWVCLKFSLKVSTPRTPKCFGSVVLVFLTT